MKLWYLQPANTKRWGPWYDKAFGFVVRAATEEAARQVASRDAGAEGPSAWLDPQCSSCVELTAEGDEEMILRDFASA